MSTVIALLNDALVVAFLGNILAAILQTYLYYRCNLDGKVLKGLVFALWVLDGLHLALITHAIYICAIADFGNYAALLQAHILTGSISDLIVRSIFVYRIWRLGGSRFNFILTPAIVSLSLLPIPGSIVIIVECVLNDTFAQMSRFAWAFYIAVAGALVADVIFSSTLCVMLAKRRTGIKWTDSIVHTLMLYSISTCAFTTFCEGAVIITVSHVKSMDACKAETYYSMQFGHTILCILVPISLCQNCSSTPYSLA
ncbi:hypothetical protein EW026_g4439 [Hermanssonia centrifuga]|uniref:DUF6534 domain-containing protein n=1 Tax=Hermanssonia centrifuga TaxID=98765 RepID=A0A4S4KHG9_9APHY|nr:hypothetical protein EW026_g4439 [Hermanssonia centrifuga]